MACSVHSLQATLMGKIDELPANSRCWLDMGTKGFSITGILPKARNFLVECGFFNCSALSLLCVGPVRPVTVQVSDGPL